jgi:hypothetical protein
MTLTYNNTTGNYECDTFSIDGDAFAEARNDLRKYHLEHGETYETATDMAEEELVEESAWTDDMSGYIAK